MGAGRKTQTIIVSEKAEQSYTVNCSTSARNLRKSDLAGVIFGCKHSTYAECLSKQLFGLPAQHFSYVKNIRAGLPLFLFNYSDRKLHGIFEAASSGQWAINPSAWTNDDSEETPYPAQVKIRIRRQCQPLLEDQYQPVIADNYYCEPKLFWFELDQAQTNKLISMFSSSPMTIRPGASLSKKTEKMNAQFKALPAPNSKQEHDPEDRSASQPGGSNMNLSSTGGSTLDPSVRPSYSSVVRSVTSADAHTTESNVGRFTSEDPTSREVKQPFTCSIQNEMVSNDKQKKWSSLFKKEDTCSDVTKEGEKFYSPAADSADLSDGDWESLCLPHCWDEDTEVVKSSFHLEDCGKHGEGASLKPNHEDFHSSMVTGPSTSSLHNCSLQTLPIARVGQDNGCFQLAASEVNLPLTENFHDALTSSCISLLEEEKHHLEVPLQENALKLPGEDMLFKSDQRSSMLSFVPQDILPTHTQLKDTEVQFTNLPFSGAALTSKINSSSIESIVAKLLIEVEELRLSQFEQAQKINYLEQKLLESRSEIPQLNDQSGRQGIGFTTNCVEADDLAEKFYSADSCHYPAFDAKICLVGGFDGCKWTPALDIYSSSEDLMRTWTSMSFLRSYASSAKFNNQLYILGGVVDGNLWYDTVESYDEESNQWTSHPPLQQKKGSFSVLSLEGRMFAFGGGNGIECFSEVEMFDPNIGRLIYAMPWVDREGVGCLLTIKRLIRYRFAPAAAEVNGTLYVAGGYNGKEYLKSIERLDPRGHSWEQLGSMSTKRGCHSMVVLNEKLYAIGGFDGTGMVSTVEVFDPRAGSWIMESPMNYSRGYFGTVVIEDEIHVIGGLESDKQVLDNAESYRIGQGWQVNNWNSIGKRCFFSAVLI
ncbi:Kelch repeat type 1 [Corchorus olitorius]|uniref:Kelch repeat type 1 n=1 Tax=Corchorus olitorius TaxID=93759 RepID=A0A1R3I673_9ROSI|nr:Kelch repeat type 1 [Corchorus olitorius]